NERQLILERNLLLFGALQCGAQQLTEPGDHAPDAARIALHQRGNRVQRIEEEVWVELRTEGRKPRVGELCPKLRRLSLEPDGLFPARPVTQEVIARDAAGEHRDVDDELVDEPQVLQTPERADIGEASLRN